VIREQEITINIRFAPKKENKKTEKPPERECQQRCPQRSSDRAQESFGAVTKN
jgi:hypothetical protein